MKKYYLIQDFEGAWLSGKTHLAHKDVDRWGYISTLTEVFPTIETAQNRVSQLADNEFYRIVEVYANSAA